jgi:membrane-associated phospholipid phosphatase
MRRRIVPRRHALKLGASAAAGLFAGAPHAAIARVDGGGRAERAYAMRTAAARAQRDRVVPPSVTNGDEQRYVDLIASYSKGLPHSALGQPDRAAFDAMAAALRSDRTVDFEAIPVPGAVRLVNPQAALAYTLDGPDPQCFSIPAPPRFDSAALAAEARELYWQALARDVAFTDYDTDATIARACRELSSTPATIFRGSTAGHRVGPYVSQFLCKEVPYGAIRLVPHVRTATAGLDYLTTWDDWLAVQNGAATASRHAGTYRYIRSARDLAAYVQLDFSYQPFLTACLVLFGMEGTTDVRRPYKGAPFDSGIPYRSSKTQSGFSTLGVAHALDLVARVANLALRHAWYHKWIVHRWMRPEEFGGRVHAVRTGRARYPVHADLLSSEALELTFQRHKSYLLPQAYPEGAPLHPSHPSGHAAVAGACATVLKAFFDESFPIEEPVLARADGLTLEPYRGPTLTVGGELDKLASNVSFGRNAAGIHWRSDSEAGLRLGEEVAIGVLTEQRHCLNEQMPGLAVTRFDGTRVVV